MARRSFLWCYKISLFLNKIDVVCVYMRFLRIYCDISMAWNEACTLLRIQTHSKNQNKASLTNVNKPSVWEPWIFLSVSLNLYLTLRQTVLPTAQEGVAWTCTSFRLILHQSLWLLPFLSTSFLLLLLTFRSSTLQNCS